MHSVQLLSRRIVTLNQEESPMHSLQGHKHEETHEGFNDLKTAAVSRDAGEDDHEQEVLHV